jgi:hypothetical protein
MMTKWSWGTAVKNKQGRTRMGEEDAEINEYSRQAA